MGVQDSFCSKGDSQNLLTKMLESIGFSINNAQLVSLEKNLIDEYIKNNPSEAKIKSHQLMLRVGMIKQSSAGIYSWLPLGFKIMKKNRTNC